MEANLSATTVATPAKCALGHWPTYTHYCWRTVKERAAPALCHPSTIRSSPHMLVSFLPLYLYSQRIKDSSNWIVCVCVRVCMQVRACMSSGQLCAFTHPCWEGGSISGFTQWPLPSRHSFHPTWQNLSLLFLFLFYLCRTFLHDWSILLSFHPLHFCPSYSYSLFCSLLFCLHSISFSLLPFVGTAVPSSAS